MTSQQVNKDDLSNLVFSNAAMALVSSDRKMKRKCKGQASLFRDDSKGSPQEEKHDYSPIVAVLPEVIALERNVLWVSERLSKHYVKKRSIYFVLDCKFEHFKLQEKCTAFIQEVYEQLNPDDLFGLLSLDQSELHNIRLEEAGKNK